MQSLMLHDSALTLPIQVQTVLEDLGNGAKGPPPGAIAGCEYL